MNKPKENKMDQEANLFARCILMPTKQFKYWWRTCKEYCFNPIQDMATIFGVEERRVIERLQDLNIK